MAATATLINNLLDTVFRGQTYTGGIIKMRLYTTSLPSSGGVEVSGGGYAAQTLSFNVASGKSISLSSSAVFSNLPAQKIVAYGVYDGATLIDEKLLSSPFTADVTNNELTINYTFNNSGS